MKKLLLSLTLLLASALSFADTTWIDVRTAGEYQADHIEGDLLIPYEQIVPKVSQLFPDKETEISLYCRSGRRAQVAMDALIDAGYTNVSNAGGINDARRLRAGQ